VGRARRQPECFEIRGSAQRLGERPIGGCQHVSLAPTPIVDEQSKCEVVEQLVGDDHPGERRRWHRRARCHPVGVTFALLSRHFDGDELERRETRRVCSPNRPRQRSGTRTGVDHGEDAGLTEFVPAGIDRAREDCAEQWPDLGARDEIASPAG